jgi:hypothetical protein
MGAGPSGEYTFCVFTRFTHVLRLQLLSLCAQTTRLPPISWFTLLMRIACTDLVRIVAVPVGVSTIAKHTANWLIWQNPCFNRLQILSTYLAWRYIELETARGKLFQRFQWHWILLGVAVLYRFNFTCTVVSIFLVSSTQTFCSLARNFMCTCVQMVFRCHHSLLPVSVGDGSCNIFSNNMDSIATH